MLVDVRRPTVISSAKQTTALQGMGGVGKSVLAAAFARSCGARRAFGDGIVWLTLGQEPDLLRVALGLGGALGDDLAEYTDLQRARNRLPKLLADKKCLLVLDDAWDVSHAELFGNALGPRCRLLVTTRDGGLAAALGAQERRLDVLEPDAALRLLADWAGQARAALPAEAQAVAAECGNLPFALALCGAMARDGAPWADLLDALRDADLAFLQAHFPNYPYPDVLRALKVSVDALAASDPTWAKHYQELAVFPQSEAVPEAAIVQLWVHTNGLNERAARQLLTTLGRKSLVRLEGEAPHRHVGLHDLQHDYLRAALRDLTGLHVELLAAYREKCPEGWHAGPNDGYFFERLAWHLARAAQAGELRALVLDYRWLRAKLGASGPGALIADYDVALDPAAPYGARDEAVRLVQGAVRLPAHVVGPDPEQLPSQLHGRLLRFKDEPIQDLLAQARRETRHPWLRPLTPSLEAPGGPLIRTLAGHAGSVRSVALTSDGRLAVSASDDQTLKVWDVESGRALHTLAGHTNRVTAVALSPDGRLVVSASWKTLKVWDVARGQELHTLIGHTKEVNAVALTPDGRLVVSASWDNSLRVWDVESGRELHTLAGHTKEVRAVALTPDDRLAVSGSDDKTLRVWDVSAGLQVVAYPCIGQQRCIAVGAAGRLVAGDFGGNVQFLHLENVSRAPIITAWRAPSPAFGCTHCRAWSQVPAAALGTELPCPHCGKAVRLNPFVINADWRPVAAAWRGETSSH